MRIKPLAYALGSMTDGHKKEKAPRLWRHIRECAPPYEASDTEAAEQCCEPSTITLCVLCCADCGTARQNKRTLPVSVLLFW